MPNDPAAMSEVERTASKFASRHVEPAAAKADHEDPRFPAEAFAAGIEAGCDRCALPENVGGHGFAMLDLASLLSILARTCAGHAMVFGVQAAVLRSMLEIKGAERIVKTILDSGRPLAVTLCDPLDSGGPDAVLTAEPGKGALALRGDALAINAAPNGYCLVFARAGGETIALMADGLGSDFGLKLESVLGLRAMPIASCSFSGLAVPDSALVARGSSADRLYDALLANLSFCVIAIASGVAESAYKKAIAYAAERVQGGKAIIDHSHIRSILGAMAAGVEAASAVARCAAAQAPEVFSALTQKASVTGTTVAICTDAVQVLGGYGYMRDFGLEKMMRDAAMLALLPISNARAEQRIIAMEKARL